MEEFHLEMDQAFGRINCYAIVSLGDFAFGQMSGNQGTIFCQMSSWVRDQIVGPGAVARSEAC